MLNSCRSFADLQSKELVPCLCLVEFDALLFLSVRGLWGGLSLNDVSLCTFEFLHIPVSSLSFIICSDTQTVVSLAIRSPFTGAPVFFT